jgi:AcrR family transcriptional regulator
MYVFEEARERVRAGGPRRRRTQLDRRTATRAALITAAIGLLSTVGFAGTTTQLIARRARVTTGALHHHFPTKDALLFAVLDHVSDRLRHKLEQSERLDPRGRPAIEALLRHLWTVYGHPEYWAVWEIIIGTRADPKLHRRIVAHREDAMRQVVYPWLARHQAGEAGPEAVATFELVLIAIRGLSLERFLDKDDAYLARNLALLAELVERHRAQAAPGGRGRRKRSPVGDNNMR